MKSFLVSEQLLRELGDMRRQVDLLIAQQQGTPGTTPYFRMYVGKVSGTISAGSITSGVLTAGSGTVTLHRLNDSGDFEAMLDGSGSEKQVAAYNWTETASGSDAWVIVGQDSLGTWLFLNEAC